MATSLSNQFLLGCCSCSSSSPFSSKSPQQPKFARFPSRPFSASNTLLGFLTPFSSLRPASLFASPQINNETEEIQIDEEQKTLPRLGVLIEAYKKAFLTGDEKIVSEIEERIQLKENEKNKLVQNVSTLSVDKVSVKEKYLRLQADFDNFRKKCDKERVGIQSDAKQGFIKRMVVLLVWLI